ncbi:MAG: hypothetical protein HY682_04195 [Chloroflexi bacterium]|nr:hypothetical protein [Chloroflexota bacterium]
MNDDIVSDLDPIQHQIDDALPRNFFILAVNQIAMRTGSPYLKDRLPRHLKFSIFIFIIHRSSFIIHRSPLMMWRLPCIFARVSC